ncbi:MAG: KpsF/GutQ family sugar-phosphate isomerase [Anaerolineae bacterium]|nr:KpsF/GutQ family sugar-phosphate isomerase [Anaerolineae bacterium]
MHVQTNEWLVTAQSALKYEANALVEAGNRLDGNLTIAVEMILAHTGKIVVSGLGKSGHVGHKIVATLCSTGTPAVFLHPAEAVHGDLGIYQPGDPTILISKNGTTAEILRLIPILRQFESTLIGIVGNISSPMAEQVDILFDASVEREADPYDLAPTSSSTVAMALGDALAITLMQARNFTPEDFARYHPAGQLGRNLLMTVFDVMHDNSEVPWVVASDPLKKVVISMTEKPLGAACVVDENMHLKGLITDGDLRRALQKYDDIRDLCALDVMTSTPTTVNASAKLVEALRLMENRPRQISVLPVIDENDGKCVGLVRIHDIYQKAR